MFLNLQLVREAEWLPNHTLPPPLAPLIGRRLTWQYEGTDEQDRPWWVTLDEAGVVLARAPQMELMFKGHLVKVDND